ncbi:hypothetical protein ACHAXN_002010 [Cyclotella atomus]
MKFLLTALSVYTSVCLAFYFPTYLQHIHLSNQQRQEIKSKLLHCQSASSDEKRSIAVLVPSENSDENEFDYLSQIANRLGLPIISALHDASHNTTEGGSSSSVQDPTTYTHLLTAVPYEHANTFALAIHANPPPSSSSKRNKKSRLKLDPIFVDLCPPANTRLGYRMQKDGSGDELLLKALGLKKMISVKNGEPLVVYDLTAGLARDSLIILHSFVGNNANEVQPTIRLHMVERDEIVALLVLDAVRRLQLLAELEGADSYTRQLVQCLSMEQCDAVQVLENLSSNTTGKVQPVPFPPDVCYLDPMFPPRKKKSSAVKKDMTMLHSLLGTADIQDDNSQSERCRIEQEQRLLEMACKCSIRRVVVKRPIAAPPLGCSSSNNVEDAIRSPSYDIRGSVNRWDVYVLS